MNKIYATLARAAVARPLCTNVYDALALTYMIHRLRLRRTDPYMVKVQVQLSVFEMDARMKCVPSLLLLIALEQVSGACMVN